MVFEPSTPDAGNTVVLRDEGGVEDEQGRKEEWGHVLAHFAVPSLARASARVRALF